MFNYHKILKNFHISSIYSKSVFNEFTRKQKIFKFIIVNSAETIIFCKMFYQSRLSY